MLRARERGMSFWPFVVALLAVVVLVLMWTSATSERDEAKNQARQAQAAKDASEKRLQEEIKKAQSSGTAVGFLSGGNTTDAEAVAAQMKEYGEKIRALATIDVPTKRYTPSETGGVAKTEGDVVKISYLTEQELADTPTVQAWLSKFETAFKRMHDDLARSLAEAGQTVEDKEKLSKTYEETLREKDARVAQLTTEKQAAENAAHEKETELNDKIADEKRQKEQRESELAAAQKQASENEAKLLAQYNEAQGTVRTLVQREAPLVSEGPDGEVVVASNGMAIVNRGKAQWLMPGTVFDVYGRRKGGTLYKKGSIKVTTTDNDTSRAAILEEMVANDPITKGDLIQSMTYSPNRKLHFVLVGDFKRLGRSQVEAVLTKLGAVVDPKVTVETNYVVVGAGDNLEESEPVKTAKDLGIRQITEEQLATFTRY